MFCHFNLFSTLSLIVTINVFCAVDILQVWGFLFWVSYTDLLLALVRFCEQKVKPTAVEAMPKTVPTGR